MASLVDLRVFWQPDLTLFNVVYCHIYCDYVKPNKYLLLLLLLLLLCVSETNVGYKLTMILCIASSRV